MSLKDQLVRINESINHMIRYEEERLIKENESITTTKQSINETTILELKQRINNLLLENTTLKEEVEKLNKYKNKGHKWLVEEEQQLLNELSSGKEIDEISLIHHRTKGGITSRIDHIVVKWYKSGISMTEIMDKTRLSEQQILQAVGKKSSKK